MHCEQGKCMILDRTWVRAENRVERLRAEVRDLICQMRVCMQIER